jgi:hypothetical protein
MEEKKPEVTPVHLRLSADSSEAEAALDRINAKLDLMLEKAQAIKALKGIFPEV